MLFNYTTIRGLIHLLHEYLLIMYYMLHIQSLILYLSPFSIYISTHLWLGYNKEVGSEDWEVQEYDIKPLIIWHWALPVHVNMAEGTTQWNRANMPTLSLSFPSYKVTNAIVEASLSWLSWSSDSNHFAKAPPATQELWRKMHSSYRILALTSLLMLFKIYNMQNIFILSQ